jgi:hypothetical protein
MCSEITGHHEGQSGQKLKQGRNLETGTEAEATEECCPLFSSWLAQFVSFPLNFFLLISMSFSFMRECLVCVYVCMCTAYILGNHDKWKRALDPLETGVRNGCKQPCGHWDLNLGPL